MTIVESLRDIQIANNLGQTTSTVNNINSCSIHSGSGSYTFGKSGNDIAKGVSTDTDILLDSSIVDKVNQNTFRFKLIGLYQLSFTCNSYISDTNIVSGLIIRFATDSSLVNGDEFSDYASTGIKSFQVNSQVATDVDKRPTDVAERPGHAVQTHSFSHYHRHTGTNDLLKVFVFGPNEAISFLEAGYTLVITYLGDK